MKILFSCVSGVDPFTIKKPTKDSNLDANIVLANDGSMIRLVRYLNKHGEEFRVVLFLTDAFSKQVKEDVEKNVFKDKNGKALDRYTWGVRQISETIQVDFIHTNIVDANKMDKLSELTEEVLRLREENPEEVIIFNTSSGTSQMQTILHLTARDMEKTEQYQLDNPNYGKQWETLKPTPSDLLLQAGTTIENEDDKEIGEDPLVHKLQLTFIKKYTVRHELEKLISSYQYNSAWELCEQNSDVISPQTKLLVKYGFKKQSLRFEEAEQIKGDWINTLSYPKMTTEEKNILEFLMLLYIHKEKGELHEFIFKMTPMLVEIIRIPFEEIFPYEKISLNPEKREMGILNKDLLVKNYPYLCDKITPDIQQELNDASFFTFNKMTLLLWLISQREPYTKYKALTEKFRPLRNIEEKFRNKIAHNIVTDLSERELVIEKPYLKSPEIFEIIFNAVDILIGQKYNIDLKVNHYDKLNTLIWDSMRDDLGFCDTYIYEVPNIRTNSISELQDQVRTIDNTINWAIGYDFISTDDKWGIVIVAGKEYRAQVSGYNSDKFLGLNKFKVKIIGFGKNLEYLTVVPYLEQFINIKCYFKYEHCTKNNRCYGTITIDNNLKFTAIVEKEFKQYVYNKANVEVTITEVYGSNIDQKFVAVPVNTDNSTQNSERKNINRIPSKDEKGFFFAVELIKGKWRGSFVADDGCKYEATLQKEYSDMVAKNNKIEVIVQSIMENQNRCVVVPFGADVKTPMEVDVSNKVVASSGDVSRKDVNSIDSKKAMGGSEKNKKKTHDLLQQPFAILKSFKVKEKNK